MNKRIPKSSESTSMDAGNSNLKFRIHQIIFESDTPAGKWFDVALLLMILSSVVVVVLETIPHFHTNYLRQFIMIEWLFTILFSLEYVLRIYCVKKPASYLFSFFGIIDLLALLPTYLSLIFVGSQYLLVIRLLRFLRIFRILKLTHFLSGQETILKALKASRFKILVFMLAIVIIVTIVGALMFVVEAESNPDFSSIPQGIYWAVTTLTTVGFGDITPVTNTGKFLSIVVMILGYAILAVPTGIISAEFMKPQVNLNSQVCRNCGFSYHDDDATFCKKCGHSLNEN